MTWKVLSFFLVIIVAGVSAALIAAAIMGHMHSVNMFQEMQNWFFPVKQAAEAVSVGIPSAVLKL